MSPLPFDLVDILLGDVASVEIVKLNRLWKVNYDRRALIVAERQFFELAGQDVAADLVIVAQEVPVVAGDVERAHPSGAAKSDQCAAHVAMPPSRLLLDDFDERPKGRRLGGHAAEREFRELTGDAKGVG